MASTYEITDEGGYSKIVLKEDTTSLRFWAINKNVKISVENGYLSIYLDEKLVIPRIPRSLITIPASISDEDLFDKLAFMSEGSGGGVPTVPSGGILYVSISGDDGTAQSGNRATPWRNPTAAVTAAVSGQKVHVLAGRYTVGSGGDIADDGLQYLMKAGVEVFLEEGVEIEYLDTGLSATQPFSDRGIGGDYKLTGKGVIILNRGRNFASPPNNQVASTLTTNIFVRLKDLDLGSRMYYTNFGDYIDFEVELGMKAQTQFWAIRPNVQLSGRFVRFAIGTLDRSEYFATNPTWAHTDVRNLIDSEVVYQFGKHLSSDFFNSAVGGHYISNIDSSKFTLKTRLATDENPNAGILKPYYTMFNCNNTQLDFDINYKDFRGMVSYINTSNTNLSGTIRLTGNVPAFTAAAGTNSILVAGGSDTRLKVKLDMDISSNHTVPVFYFHNLDDGSTVSGYLKSRSGTTPPIGPINNASFSASPHATLHNLLIETAFANCFDNTSGGTLTVPNVNVIDVVSNVAPNGARITERIQTITANANLKA